MTLTYRGQKYVQNYTAATNSKRPVIVYRGHKRLSNHHFIQLIRPAPAGLFLCF